MNSMHYYSIENIENINVGNQSFKFDTASGRLLMPDGRTISITHDGKPINNANFVRNLLSQVAVEKIQGRVTEIRVESSEVKLMHGATCINTIAIGALRGKRTMQQEEPHQESQQTPAKKSRSRIKKEKKSDPILTAKSRQRELLGVRKTISKPKTRYTRSRMKLTTVRHINRKSSAAFPKITLFAQELLGISKKQTVVSRSTPQVIQGNNEMVTFVKELVQAHLTPYLEGRITSKNENVNREPLPLQILKQLQAKYPEKSFDLGEIATIAIQEYVHIAAWKGCESMAIPLKFSFEYPRTSLIVSQIIDTVRHAVAIDFRGAPSDLESRLTAAVDNYKSLFSPKSR